MSHTRFVVSSKNRKKDLTVHIPGGGNNASCDDAMELVHVRTFFKLFSRSLVLSVAFH